LICASTRGSDNITAKHAFIQLDDEDGILCHGSVVGIVWIDDPCPRNGAADDEDEDEDDDNNSRMSPNFSTNMALERGIMLVVRETKMFIVRGIIVMARKTKC
jgi:hypothetical protein